MNTPQFGFGSFTAGSKVSFLADLVTRKVGAPVSYNRPLKNFEASFKTVSRSDDVDYRDGKDGMIRILPFERLNEIEDVL